MTLDALLPPALARRQDTRPPRRMARAAGIAVAIMLPTVLLLAPVLLDAAGSVPDVGRAIFRSLPWYDALANEAAGTIEAAAAEADTLPEPPIIPILHFLDGALSGAFIMALLAVAAGLVTWRLLSHTRYILTDTHLHVTRATRLGESYTIVALDQITDLRIHRGIIDRLFGTSSITIHTRGGSAHLFGLTDPRPIVEAYRARTTPRAPPLPAPPPAAPLWAERLSPRGIASATVLYAIGPVLILAAPHLVETGALARANLMILGAAGLLLSTTWIVYLVTSRYTIADGSVCVTRGILGRSDRRMDLARISDVEVKRPPLARLFHCGHLVVRGESGQTLTLYGLRDPEAAGAAIDHHRRRLGGLA